MSKTPLDHLGVEAILKKGWFAAHKYLLARRTAQLGILFLFIIGPVAGYTILKGNLSSSILLGLVPMTDPMLFLQMLAGGYFGITSSAIIGAALVLMFYMIVGGRVFCSWVCPVNMVTDSAHWLRRKLGIKGGQKLSADLRYWILGLVFVTAFATGNLAWEMINPVSMLHRGLIFGFGFGWVIVLGIFLYDLIGTRHGWCGHLCPMGAFYGLVGSIAPVRVLTSRRAACDDCMECYEVCPEPQVLPMALKGAENGYPAIILSKECTNCGRCLDICAKEVFQFGLRYKGMKVSKFTSRQVDGVGIRN